MRYFGSKVSTIDTLYDLISRRVPSGSFCDPFGGIGSVGSYFRSKGYDVWSGDVLNFAHFFQIAKLKNVPSRFKNLKRHLGVKADSDVVLYLNSLTPQNGWFVRQYSQDRSFFTERNARKIQACRTKIKAWARQHLLTRDEHAILLASLVNSMDRVANTAGTYYAYLKKWHRKALKDFQFQLLSAETSGRRGHCFHESAQVLVRRQHFDILYLDPPFNERSYWHYYHLPETMALERTPKVHGISGIPDSVGPTSDFNRPNSAVLALDGILEMADFDLLVFHYADDGIITPRVLRRTLSNYGHLEEFFVNSIGYSTKRQPRRTEHHLYLVSNA